MGMITLSHRESEKALDCVISFCDAIIADSHRITKGNVSHHKESLRHVILYMNNRITICRGPRIERVLDFFKDTVRLVDQLHPANVNQILFQIRDNVSKSRYELLKAKQF